MIDYKESIIQFCKSEINRGKLVKPENMSYTEWTVRYPQAVSDRIKQISTKVMENTDEAQVHMMNDPDFNGDILKIIAEAKVECVKLINNHKEELRKAI